MVSFRALGILSLVASALGFAPSSKPRASRHLGRVRCGALPFAKVKVPAFLNPFDLSADRPNLRPSIPGIDLYRQLGVGPDSSYDEVRRPSQNNSLGCLFWWPSRIELRSPVFPLSLPSIAVGGPTNALCVIRCAAAPVLLVQVLAAAEGLKRLHKGDVKRCIRVDACLDRISEVRLVQAAKGQLERSREAEEHDARLQAISKQRAAIKRRQPFKFPKWTRGYVRGPTAEDTVAAAFCVARVTLERGQEATRDGATSLIVSLPFLTSILARTHTHTCSRTRAAEALFPAVRGAERQELRAVGPPRRGGLAARLPRARGGAHAHHSQQRLQAGPRPTAPQGHERPHPLRGREAYHGANTKGQAAAGAGGGGEREKARGAGFPPPGALCVSRPRASRTRSAGR